MEQQQERDERGGAQGQGLQPQRSASAPARPSQVAEPQPAGSPTAAPSPIFRAQAVAASQDKWLGSVRIAQSWRFSTYTGLALLVGALVASFAVWGSFTRKAKLPGLLVPTAGALAVSAAAQGVVAQVHVAESQSVQAGQTLFTIDTDRAAAQGPIAELLSQHISQRQQSLQSEAALRSLQHRQRLDALAQRDASLAAEERQVLGELDLMAQRTSLAQKSLQRQQELAKSGFVSEAQTQAKAEELIDLQTRQRSAERNRVALARERQSLQAEQRSLATSWQTEQEQLKRSLSSLAQEATEAQARRTYLVQAAEAGQITALHIKPGQQVLPGSSLATLVPAQGQTLQAHLYAPSRSAGFVAPGQTVLLRYAAYPYQKFGMHEGQVQQVSTTPINPSELPPGSAQALMSAAQSNEPLYRITVQLQRQTITTYGEPQALKPGTALDVEYRTIA